MKIFNIKKIILFILILSLTNINGEKSERIFKWQKSPEDRIIEISMPSVFSDEVIELIKIGISLSVCYEISFLRKTMWGLLLPVANIVYEKKMTYDPEAKVFIIKTPERIFKEDSLKDAIDRFNDKDIIVLSADYPKGKIESYVVKGRVKVSSVQLLPPFSFIIGLMNVYNFNTSWMEIK